MRQTYALCMCNECKGTQSYHKSQIRRHIIQYGAYDPLQLGHLQRGPLHIDMHENLEGDVQRSRESSEINVDARVDIEHNQEPDPQGAVHMDPRIEFMMNLPQLGQTLLSYRANGVAEKDIVAIMNTCWDAVVPVIPEDTAVQLPTTFYKLESLAGVRYDTNNLLLVCRCQDARCRTLNRWKSDLGDRLPCVQCGVVLPQHVPDEDKFIMFDLAERLSTCWANEKIAAMIHQHREEGDGDVWCADLYSGLSLVDHMCFSMTCDAAELKKQSNSWTPVVLRWLNLPAHVRHTPGALFLWAHVSKNIPVPDVLDFLMGYYRDVFADGLEIFDAHTKSTRRVKIEITRLLEDYQYVFYWIYIALFSCM